MNRRSAVALLGIAVFAATLSGQAPPPEIPFDANADLLTLPAGTYMGEVAGVATNSKGHIFTYTRTGPANATVGASRTFYKAGSRLFEFDEAGKFVREIGQGVYGFSFAEAVRIDSQDNIWVVDQGSTQVIKFDPTGRIQLVLGRKPEAIAVAGGAGGAGRGAAAVPGDNFSRTSDVAWDRDGNIYVADGLGSGAGNARVAKFDKTGKFLLSWGSRGSAPGEFNSLRGIAVDAAGLVYVADAGNHRIQVFDGAGHLRSQIANIGTPSAICMTPGPHQYLYSSNSNDPETLDHGEIYKLELNGTIAGRFGKAGKLPKEFGTVNAIDCRTENVLYVGELLNWRVQKLMLRPGR